MHNKYYKLKCNIFVQLYISNIQLTPTFMSKSLIVQSNYCNSSRSKLKGFSTIS